MKKKMNTREAVYLPSPPSLCFYTTADYVCYVHSDESLN